MSDNSRVSVQRLVRQMESFDSLLPKGEGAVCLVLYADGSWCMKVEMWGVTVAKRTEGEYFVLDTAEIERNNPTWLNYLEGIVEKLNYTLPNAQAQERASKPLTNSNNEPNS